MISKAALLERLSQLEEQIAQLRRQIEQGWSASKLAKSKQTFLRGKFPQLKTLTEAEIDQVTRIWDEHIESALHEF